MGKYVMRIRTSVERLSPLLEQSIVRNLASSHRDTFQMGLLQVERFYREMQPSKAIPMRLCAALRSRDTDVRERTARTFATIGGDVHSLRCLTVALRDSSPGVRDYACQALGKSGLPAAVPHVKKALADPDDQVRFSALNSLAELNAPLSRKELLHCATESSSLVRLAAVQSMTQLVTATRRARTWVLEFFSRRLEEEGVHQYPVGSSDRLARTQPNTLRERKPSTLHAGVEHEDLHHCSGADSARP